MVKIRKISKKVILLITILLAITVAAITVIRSQNQPINAYISLYLVSTPQESQSTIRAKTITITDNYNFTEDVYDSVVVLADNIVINGNFHTVHGPGSGDGFTLTGRSNVTIMNIKVTGWEYGFLLKNSSNNILSGNTANNNGEGFLLLNSSNNILSGNTANNNGEGFLLHENSNNNILSGNTANNNGGDGFDLSGSYNTLLGNTANNNGRTVVGRGFHLLFGSHNNVTGNTATNNYEGFQLYLFSNNNFTGNNATENECRGFLVISSLSNNFTGNTANDNDYGFLLENSSYNTLSGNTAINNSAGHYYYRSSGFWLYNSSYNTLSGNTAINDNDYGFYLTNSSYNILSGNTANNNFWHGFYLVNSTYNNLTNNTANNNGHYDDYYLQNSYGFYLVNSTYNNLSGNTANNNNKGIHTYNNNMGFFLSNSSYNNLSCNNATNNDYGLHLYNSSYNNLSCNNATNNDYGFYLLYRSSGNNLLGNTALNNTRGGYNWTSDCINNNFTGSVEANYLRVKVMGVLGSPIPSADVKVETDGTDIYKTTYFDGSDPKTDSNGVTPWILVQHGIFTTNDTMTENTTTVTVYYQGLFIVGNNPRTVSMFTPHLETFQVDDANPTVAITIPPIGATVSTGVVWINGTFNGTGSQVTRITINDPRFTLVEPLGPPYGVTGTYSFKATIPLAGEFDLEVTVEDESGYEGTAKIHLVVVVIEQPSPSPAVFFWLMLSSAKGGVSPLVYATVGIIGVVGVVAAVLLYYFHFRTRTPVSSSPPQKWA